MSTLRLSIRSVVDKAGQSSSGRDSVNFVTSFLWCITRKFALKGNDLVIELLRRFIGISMWSTRKVNKTVNAFLFKTCNVLMRGWS